LGHSHVLGHHRGRIPGARLYGFHDPGRAHLQQSGGGVARGPVVVLLRDVRPGPPVEAVPGPRPASRLGPAGDRGRQAQEGPAQEGSDMIDDEADLYQAVLANSGDAAPRLVYADWLEERGDPRGEYLRLDWEASNSVDARGVPEPVRDRLADLRRRIRP